MTIKVILERMLLLPSSFIIILRPKLFFVKSNPILFGRIYSQINIMRRTRQAKNSQATFPRLLDSCGGFYAAMLALKSVDFNIKKLKQNPQCGTSRVFGSNSGGKKKTRFRFRAFTMRNALPCGGDSCSARRRLCRTTMALPREFSGKNVRLEQSALAVRALSAAFSENAKKFRNSVQIPLA